MPPRKRNTENVGLPKRWTLKHGAYYYRVPPGQEHQWDDLKWFPLGRTLSAAYKVWAERLEDTVTVRTIGQLLERYALEVVPTKAPKTQTDNAAQMKRIYAVFGHMPIAALRPRHFYQYQDKREAKVAGRRELALLSHALTKAVEWGLIDRHPTKGEVRMEGEPARTRYVEDWEVVEVLSLKPRRKKGSVRVIQAYIRLKLLTGMSQGDLLRLKPAEHFKSDGIHIQRHKTRKRSSKTTIYEWTPELREAVKMVREATPKDIAPHLFCTGEGKSYVSDDGGTGSWKTMWQRFMKRALAETKLTERFTEHDLRAKAGSDAESLEHARQLLSHVDARVTARVYRRKPERVRPLRFNETLDDL
ncbi:MAG: hypothetical protein J5I81_07825 [Nitrococcus mobilis]|nr:hypothetical protein [Nitrococcus mobilis]